VRRRVDIIILSCAILCCVLGAGVTAASAQTPPSLGAQAAEQAEQPAGPAEVGPAGTAADAAAAQPSAAATPDELQRTPERFGGIPASNGTPVAPSRPRFSIGKALGVTTTRVGQDDNSDDSSGGSAPPANCDVQSDVQILDHQPTGKTREVATLDVDGAPAQHEDILALLKRKACEAGANAVLIKRMVQTRVEGVKVDHVEAVGLIVGTPKPPVDPSPVPKSITVTPEGPAVPKTITVDPDASP
jgi:hypothetical protein